MRESVGVYAGCGSGAGGESGAAGLPGNQPISHGQLPAVPDVQSPPRAMELFAIPIVEPRLCALRETPTSEARRLGLRLGALTSR